MTTQRIVESGMEFGPYAEGRCFHIEKSESYKNIEDHIKIAEFLLLHADEGKSPVLWIVEAKSSSPRPETRKNFDDFIAKIREKLVNAFSLGWACCLGRHQCAERELPDAFKKLNLSRVDLKFVLVIHGHRESWLPPLQDALRIALLSTVKTWAFSPTSVAVINDALAREYGLILPGQRGDA